MSLAFDLTASIFPDFGLKMSRWKLLQPTPLLSPQQGHVQGAEPTEATQEMDMASAPCLFPEDAPEWSPHLMWREAALARKTEADAERKPAGFAEQMARSTKIWFLFALPGAVQPGEVGVMEVENWDARKSRTFWVWDGRGPAHPAEFPGDGPDFQAVKPVTKKPTEC